MLPVEQWLQHTSSVRRHDDGERGPARPQECCFYKGRDNHSASVRVRLMRRDCKRQDKFRVVVGFEVAGGVHLSTAAES